ncbi:F0F1 ATP synthase subunit epsilon [Candidatus Kaiserbacteria bacterium]|nr:F0F1 ATP synthase subunit epsilon [Candidatus Kaiserbacteria bacterium]
MKVTIAKVHENLFSGEALSLSAKTTEGEVTILPKHEPFVANLGAGIVSVRTAEGEQKFDILGGVLEVSANQATVLL